MRQEKIILSLAVVASIMAILLLTGVAYAAETGNILKISDKQSILQEQQGFKVVFTDEPTYFGSGCATVNIKGDTNATIDITNLEEVGDSTTVVFTITNKSEYIYADVQVNVTNTNTEYFNVTSTLSDSRISPPQVKRLLQ